MSVGRRCFAVQAVRNNFDCQKRSLSTEFFVTRRSQAHLCPRNIHKPSAVQGHGYLLVMERATLSVTQVSANVVDLGYEINSLLGTSLMDVIGATAFDNIQTTIDIQESKPMSSFPVEFGVGEHRKTLASSFHVRGTSAFLELEPYVPVTSRGVDAGNVQVRCMSQKLLTVESSVEGCQLLTQSVQSTTGFDRVMVYMFHPDQHGEVIAETLRPDSGVESLKGLHFPAHDIPEQARACFVRNIYSHIPHVKHDEIPLVPVDCPHSMERPDMTLVSLRSVAPGCTQYYLNLGIQASLVVSLVVDGQLWGLLICHHMSPKFVPFYERVAAAMVSEVLSLFISVQQRLELARQQESAGRAQRRMVHCLKETHDPQAAFVGENGNVSDLLKCTGACCVIDGVVHRFGVTPTEEDILELVSFALEHSGGVLCSTNLPDVYPNAEKFSEHARGCLLQSASTTTKDLKEGSLVCIWFRGSITRNVYWAGDPASSFIPGGMVPRSSFRPFSQTETLSAVPWTRSDEHIVSNFVRDISLQLAEIKCQQAEHRLRRMQMKDQFIANISHEIRTPLYAINGMAEECIEAPHLPSDLQEPVELIHASGTSLLSLLNDIIDVKKLEDGKLQLVPQDVNVVQLARFCLKMFSKQLKAKGLLGKLIYTPSLEHTTLSIDKTRLQQLYVNLISNALKFTNTGSITVRLTHSQSPSELTVSVEDTGIGIKDSDLPKLFDKFEQVDTSEKRVFHGAGLGLYIVKQILDLMNGKLGVQSEWQKGCQFWFKVCAPCSCESNTAWASQEPCEEVVIKPSPSQDMEASRASITALVSGSESTRSTVAWASASRSSSEPSSLARHCADPPPCLALKPLPLTPVPSRARPSPKSAFKRMFRAVFSTRSSDSCSTPSSPSETLVPQASTPISPSAPSNMGMRKKAKQRAAPEPPRASIPIQVRSRGGLRRRILVAEDNPVLQKVTLSMLSPVADCVIVPDGEDVLEKLGESTAYALILMDLQMPRLDGVETTKAVRAIPQCDHIPIVGFTASSIQSELDACKAAGMIEVLSKNLPRAQLQSFVSRYTQPAPQSDAVSELSSPA